MKTVKRIQFFLGVNNSVPRTCSNARSDEEKENPEISLAEFIIIIS